MHVAWKWLLRKHFSDQCVWDLSSFSANENVLWLQSTYHLSDNGSLSARRISFPLTNSIIMCLSFRERQKVLRAN